MEVGAIDFGGMEKDWEFGMLLFPNGSDAQEFFGEYMVLRIQGSRVEVQGCGLSGMRITTFYTNL